MQTTGTVSALLREKPPVVHAIESTATVFEAIELMAEQNVGGLPVIQQGRLVGMFTERDYTRKVILMGRSSKETLVDQIMTRNPLVVGLDETIGECMQIMTEEHVRHLPVVSDERLIGILSIGDLVKWIISSQDATIEQLTRYVFGEQVS